MVACILLIVAYAALLTLVLALFARTKEKTAWFTLVWCVILYVPLNILGVLYSVIYQDFSVFIYRDIGGICIGLGLNLLFIIFWILGYVIVLKKLYPPPRRDVEQPEPEPLMVLSEKTFAFAVMVLSLLFYCLYLRRYSYGQSQAMYEVGMSEVGTHGVRAFIGNLTGPVIAALLFFDAKVRRKTLKLSRGASLALWAGLGILAVVGATIEIQRGDLLEVCLWMFFILLIQQKHKAALTAVVTVSIALLVVSPVITAARSGDQVGSMDNFVNASDDYWRSDAASSIRSFARDRSEQGTVLPVTSYLLYRRANTNGYVGLAAYPGIVVDVIPRFIYPNKPYPLSIDGTAAGTPSFIASRMLGLYGVTSWTGGGGEMYWQLGWVGLVFGGMLIGAIWAFLTVGLLRTRSLLYVVFFFLAIGYGFNLFESLNVVLHRLFKIYLYLGVVWIIVVRVMVLRQQKLLAKRARRARLPRWGPLIRET